MHNTTESLSVDWNAGRLMPAPRANRPHRRETFYPAKCSRCGSVRWLRKCDARKGCQCSHCARSDAGKRGYAATVAAHGRDFAITKIQAYRLDHPSKPEAAVADHLSEIGVEFSREHRLDGAARRYLLDFAIKRGGKMIAAVEVNGYYHSLPARQLRDRDLLAESLVPLLMLDASQLDFAHLDRFLCAVMQP